MYFLYKMGSSLMISSAIVTSRIICTYSSISACRNALGMSVTTMYLLSFASIAHDNRIPSKDTVGELSLSFVVYSYCGLPSVHTHALIELSHFSFRNMIYLRALFLLSYVMFPFRTGSSAFCLCNCLNSFKIAHFLFL